MPPRRALAYLLKLINSWPEQIILQINRAKKKDTKLIVKKVYEDFIFRVGELMKSAGYEYSQFNAEFILDLVKEVQNEMKVIATEIDIDNPSEYKVNLDGSFFNGLAKKGSSDIDLFYTHPQLKDFILRKSFKEKVQNIFNKYQVKSWDLNLEDVASLIPEQIRNSKEFTDQFAEMGVVSFRVSLKKVELLVYTAKVSKQKTEPVVFQINLN